MPSILTDTEREAIRERWIDFPADVGTQKVRETEWAVRDFSREPYRGGQIESACWAARILENLSEGVFEFHEPRGTFTIEDVTAAFEQDQAEIWAEHVAWWEDDPEDFSKSHRNIKGAPTEHPWGDDTIAMCRRWAQETTPYQLWKFKHTVEEAALDILRESLLDLATEIEDGSRIGSAASEAFDKAIDALAEQLTQ